MDKTVRVTGLKRGGMDHTDTQFYLGRRSHEEKKLTVMWLFEGVLTHPMAQRRPNKGSVNLAEI